MSTHSPRSPLLSLPVELRLMIYESTFSNRVVDISHQNIIVHGQIWPDTTKTAPRISNTAAESNGGLLLTCRELKTEATQSYHQHSIFYGAEPEDIRTWLCHRSFFNRIHQRNDLHFIREIRCGLHWRRQCSWNTIDQKVILWYGLMMKKPTGDETPAQTVAGGIRKNMNQLAGQFSCWGLSASCVYKGTAERIGEEEKWNIVGQAVEL